MNLTPVQFRDAIRLERLLGDPGVPSNLLSFHNAIRWDEQEEFPEEAIGRLHQTGLHHVYVPTWLGGRFESGEAFIALGRVLARRNMSVAVSYSTMLWMTLAWLGGDGIQQERIAQAILRDGEFPCLAYSEELHGADLVGNETRARRDKEGRYRVTGDKRPINRATRSRWIVLLARTSSGSHLRNHSLFIFDRSQLDPKEHHSLPQARTHGLRGCDISGIGFRDCLLPPGSRIGEEGEGIELALKGFQITRTFCTALSLGVGDSALRIVADFALNRRLYGKRVLDLPHARDTLANAYLSLLISECATFAAARGLHLFPGEFSTWSSIAKVQVARLTDHAVHQLGAILGARSYLREGHHDGMFQKFLRDGAIVAVFDGNSIVCLDRLASALPKLCRSRNGVQEEEVATLFDLQRPLPAVAFERFTLLGRGRDHVMQSLPGLAGKLVDLAPDRHCDESMLERLRAQVLRLQMGLAELQSSVSTRPKEPEPRNSAARFGCAERYCALHSAICCLGFWLHNRDRLGGFVARGEWLEAALLRQGEAAFRCGTMSPALTDALCAQLLTQTEGDQMYSLLPWPLAARGQLEQADILG